jgi:hypothetical protein
VPYVKNLDEPKLTTSNHKEMKQNFVLSTCLNRILATLFGILFLFSTSNALGFVFKSSFICPELPGLQSVTVNSGVIYASFDAVMADKSIIVKWVTASEQDNGHFEIERSVDMKRFTTIALVLDGFSADGTGKSYKFRDKTDGIDKGLPVYYRLKQIGNDGKATYSNVITVMGGESKVSRTQIELSPNPVIDDVALRFSASESGLTEVRIYNIYGKELLSKQSTINKGSVCMQLNGFSKLPHGTYIARLSMNGKNIGYQKLLRQ